MSDTKLEVLLSAKDISAGGFEAFKRRISSVVGSVFTLQGAMAAVGSGYGFYKLTEKLGITIDKASDLEEATSKFGEVFKGQTDLAERWSAELEDGFAMSERAAKQNLSSIQDLLVPMGMYPDAAARMSFETVKLAADLGSFNNASTAKVMDDMQSAMVGNYETMKKYGVVLTAASVKQRALEMGLANTKNELTAAHKAQAAFEIILKSSSAAIGDMDRTSDQYANTTKRLDAEIEDLSATLGKKFVPAATAAKSATAGFVGEINKIIEGPGIDDMIFKAEARLNMLLLEQERKEQTRQQKRLERERRFQSERERFLKKVAGPAGSKSEKFLDSIEELKRKDHRNFTDEELELRYTRRRLEYLKDIKRLQDLSAFERKKNDLEGFGVVNEGPATVPHTFGPVSNNWLDESRRLNDIERRILHPNWAKEKIDRELPYMTEYIDHWQIQAREAEAVEERHWRVIGEIQEAGNHRMIELSQRTADALEQNFSDFFFDSFTGQLKDMGDYWEAFLTSMKRAWADIMGQMAKEWIFGDEQGAIGVDWMGMLGKVAGLFGGGSSGPAHIGVGGTTAFRMASGGVVGEHVVGVGLQSGRSYEFGEGGIPEVVIPRDKFSFGPAAGSGGVSIEVHNHVAGVQVETRESVGPDGVTPKVVLDIIENNAFAVAHHVHDATRWNPALRSMAREIVG